MHLDLGEIFVSYHSYCAEKTKAGKVNILILLHFEVGLGGGQALCQVCRSQFVAEELK